MEVVEGNIATFPNGLRLKLRPNKMSKQLIFDAAQTVPDVPVPLVYIEENGRLEENPQDPKYIKAVEEQQNLKAWASIKALLVLGTKIETLPEDTDGPEETDWEEWSVLRGGKPIPADRYSRYESWLRYFGLLGGDSNELIEFIHLVRALFTMAGMTSEEAARIVATFRHGEGRGTDNEGGAVATDADGHVNPATVTQGS